MKILELRFKNLNSLYGEWVIDFTNQEYISNGIFVLSGPTGAGKSTILDAICLALYGSTPRLGKITKSGNEIMSQLTGECYAEVLFESQAGRFRCHWEQRRARKRADGNLQDQEHQIADDITGKPIETKKSMVLGVIEEKTGMDFDRFTRSILLAQGGFDTFLRADVEHKSRILEQITGTGIYSEISCRVHDRQREEREKLNMLQAETSGILILQPQQEAELQLEFEAKNKLQIELSVKLTEAGKAIAWLGVIDGLKKEISNLNDETISLQRDIEAFRPQRDKLDLGIKAALLDGTYATLTAVRRQQVDDLSALKAGEVMLPEMEKSANKQAQSLKFAEQQTFKAKEERKAAGPVIQKIRLLDQKLAAQQKSIAEVNFMCLRDETKINGDKQSRLKELEKRSAAKKNMELVDVYLKEHAQDEWLISGLTGIEEQLCNLLNRQKEILEKEQDLKKTETVKQQAEKKLESYTRLCGSRKLELENAVKKVNQGKEALRELLGDRLLREYRTEKDALLREMAFLRKIEELETYRSKLEDGQSCPLCGSKEHPFALGNVPVSDGTEQKIESLTNLITKAEALETNNKKMEETEAFARKNLSESEKLETIAFGEKMASQRALAELSDSLEKLRAAFIEQKQVVSEKLNRLGIMELPENRVSSVVYLLRSRLNAWNDLIKKKGEIEKMIAAFDSEINRMDAVIETQSTALAEKRNHLEMLKREYVVGCEERKKLYGDIKPDDEEMRLNKAVTDAEEAEKKAGNLNNGLQQKLISAKNYVESLEKRIEQRLPELKEAESGFLSILVSSGFSDERQFLEARLTNEQRNSLSAKAKKFDDAQADINARQKDRKVRLECEIARNVTDKTLEDLELQFGECDESLKVIRDDIAGLKHKLNENETAKERIKEKEIIIEAQKKECNRWERLHELIGSADGKKYRNFAQGLTFELMVSHANRQLEKMSDRYLLIRDEQQPLELNVVDNYQAGEIRSTRNLSGGESFIVSLALALGLSRMASRKVRVDSLFLDEGFGTLDEESLETALDALSGLHQDSKLIGVISHVSALKERIHTQINVIPVFGGRSTISGPGCRKGSCNEIKSDDDQNEILILAGESH